jgi:ABC-type sugar transport system permease subunit/ABC-type glycerol-3-phosphate transport system substrate-binding protein
MRVPWGGAFMCARRRRGAAVVFLAWMACVVASATPALAREQRRIKLTVWGWWNREGYRQAAAEFERRHPHIDIVMSTAGGQMDEQKLMTAIAGGSPPDVINQDRFSVGGWAARDAFLPLDAFVARDGAIRAEDYYPACWNEAVYEGRLYAVPNSTDDRLLFFNEDLLRRAGFVNAAGEVIPPRTWDELKHYAVRMTRRDARGNLTQVGFVPNYGNSWLYLYGWQNGGRFLSEDGRTCLLNEPAILGALEWVTGVYDALGGATAVDSFTATFQGGELDPLLTGKVAMKIDGNAVLNFIASTRPDFNFGVAPPPVPEGREPLTWSGGFSWAIPRGAKHPEEAWEFIKWMSSVEAGLLIADAEYRWNRSWGRLYVPEISPNKRINEAVLQRYAPRHPRFERAFRLALEMMNRSRYRPVTPVGQVLWDEHVRAMDLAIHRKLTPKQALDVGTLAVQKALDRIHQRKHYPPLDMRIPIGIGAALSLAGLGLFGWGLRRDLRQQRGPRRHETLAGFLFIAPWLAGFMLLTAGPVVASILLSFCEYDVLHPVAWAGLDNYRALPRDPLFWKSLANTLFMVLGVPLGMAVSLGVAMLLNARVKGMAFYRTIYYLPAIVPAVASSILWIWVLNPQFGLVNVALQRLFGIAGPQWLQSELWSKPSILLMGLWGAGAGMIIWLAGLKGIPETLYEAAEIDGAGKCAAFRHVTLPMLSPYIFFNLIMGVIGTFQIFTQAYIMTSGGPVDSTLFYVYYLFNNAFRYFKMGYASALAWILFLIILALTLVQLRLGKRWVYYEGEK